METLIPIGVVTSIILSVVSFALMLTQRGSEEFLRSEITRLNSIISELRNRCAWLEEQWEREGRPVPSPSVVVNQNTDVQRQSPAYIHNYPRTDSSPKTE